MYGLKVGTVWDTALKPMMVYGGIVGSVDVAWRTKLARMTRKNAELYLLFHRDFALTCKLWHVR
jgi:hypothetical protein